MKGKNITATATLMVSLFAIAGSAVAQTRQPVPVPATPKDKTYKSLRAVQYCEVWLFHKTAQGGTDIVYYNTSDYNNSENKMDTCPAGMWANVEPAELKAKYDIEYAFKNGPRGWTMDHITLPVGSVVEFAGLKTRWMGQGELPPGVQMKPGEATYKSVESHRKSSMTFEKGKPVFILDDPDGIPWVMQAYSGIVDKTITYDSLKDLGAKLKMPDGWKYRVVTLDKDLVISTPGGFAWITQDDLQNTYDACKNDACNYKP
jgi:hypothetical protein